MSPLLLVTQIFTAHRSQQSPIWGRAQLIQLVSHVSELLHVGKFFLDTLK